MKTHTVFTLRDGSRHDTSNKAKEHCLEMMGAETRNMLDELIFTQYLQKAALKLIDEKKWDKDIREYIAWRDEHDALLRYEEEDDEW